MSKSKSKADDLLASIQRMPIAAVQENNDPASADAVASENSEPAKARSAAKPVPAPQKGEKSKRGKPSQFWMHDADRKLLRELSAWLAGQGVRPTDSMVIRAALRLAKPGGALLEAYWQSAKLDGRIKRD